MAATIMKITSKVNKFDFRNKHILVHIKIIMQHILVQLKKYNASFPVEYTLKSMGKQEFSLI